MRNILLLLLLLIAGTWWMRHNERKRNAERPERDERMRTSPGGSGSHGGTTARQSLPPAERMVRCSECDTYLPESESLSGAGGKHFCSSAHRDAYLAREHRV